MKIVMEIGKFEHGTYNPKVKDGQQPTVETWLRLMGRPVPDEGAEATESRWVRAISYKRVAEALKHALGELTYDGDKIGALRVIVDLEGEWKTKTTADKVIKSFEIHKFEIRTGPSVELARLRRDADVKLAEAGAAKAGGDLSSAYLALESFVAGIALRAPGVEGSMQVSMENGPEEQALKAFARADGKEVPVRQSQEPTSSAKVEAPADPEPVAAPVVVPEMVTHEPEAQVEAMPESGAEDEPDNVTDAVTEVSPEVSSAPVDIVADIQAAVEAEEKAAPVAPPRAPLAPRMPMLRRPPPSVPGMKP